MTLTEQIMQAIVAALGGVGKPAALTVLRALRRPTDNGELPVAIVRAKLETVAKAHPAAISPVVRRTLTVLVTLRAQGIDADLDAYRAWTIAAVMQAWKTTGSSLSTLATEIEEVQHDWDPRSMEQLAAVADYAEDDVSFLVHYETNRYDPTIRR